MKSSYKTNVNIIPDEGFRETMNREAIPFLSSIGEKGYLERGRGGSLYYEAYRPSNPLGAIVISHGYSESIEKYKEVIYYFTGAGYQVYLADHRGHGRSLRDTDHPNMIHVNRFMDYAEDLHALITQVARPSAGDDLPFYLYAHSMGGGIGALYLETWPGTFRKAILTAPMLAISMGNMPGFCARALARTMVGLKRGALYAPGQHPFVPGERFEESCSACPQRFGYYQEKKEAEPLFQTSGCSYGWAYEALNACRRITQKRNCQKITAPVLVFQSANDTAVKASGIERFVKNTPSARLIKVEGSRHEIYNSPAKVLEAYYRNIFEFLQSE